jgi:hypothetical protein
LFFSLEEERSQGSSQFLLSYGFGSCWKGDLGGGGPRTLGSGFGRYPSGPDNKQRARKKRNNTNERGTNESFLAFLRLRLCTFLLRSRMYGCIYLWQPNLGYLLVQTLLFAPKHSHSTPLHTAPTDQHFRSGEKLRMRMDV